LDPDSQFALNCFTAFYLAQALLAVFLMVMLRRTQGALNGVLPSLALIWTVLMYGATQVAAMTL
jgi:hypothetical protein